MTARYDGRRNPEPEAIERVFVMPAHVALRRAVGRPHWRVSGNGFAAVAARIDDAIKAWRLTVKNQWP